MPLILLVVGILVLFILVVKFKLNGFLSLLITCLFVGIIEGLPALKTISSIETGVGGTLGHLGLILGIGAMFGRVLADGGAAQKIASTLINKFGRKNIIWAMSLTGFIIGITLFWEVSFVILIPIVFTIAIAGSIPLLEVMIPMLAAITVAHSFLPPHPGPIAVANILGANVGVVLLYGLIISIPALICSGPLFFMYLKKRGYDPKVPKGLATHKVFKEEELPGFGVSCFTALVPVAIIITATIIGFIVPKDSSVATFFSFIGNTDIALLIALLASLYFFGTHQGKSMTQVMATCEEGAKSIAMILLIIGGGGALKQVILDSGVGTYVANIMLGLPLSPYLLAWLVTAILRLCIGSATVTLFTAAGIILPLIQQTTGVSIELMVLMVTCGSVFCDPPSDAAFWMVKEFMGLTFSENIEVWCGLTSIISLIGCGGVMILSLFIH
ncbi:gluconate:H+ symporter [Clostridium sp. HV4-5-A1G]|uniref:gluconate:H+ symporter n=1 Tax=Clostridium sp. HV4-5-A1G TaxID=2004595 RepID=UPI00123B4211|nr:gluconate:H+ symporter [Clostridium sp. HV4-5-A1G]KAA8679075.1 TRAP transporter large permease subunit [Clostridium sp. HV4-5-A1G]